MSQDLGNQADWLAVSGYFGVASDLFLGRRTTFCMISIMRQARARRGRVSDEIQGWRAWLSAREDRTGKVGGDRLLPRRWPRIAGPHDHGFSAVSVNYGTAF